MNCGDWARWLGRRPRLALCASVLVLLVLASGGRVRGAAQRGSQEVAGQWRGVTKITGTMVCEDKEWIRESGRLDFTDGDSVDRSEVRFTLVSDPTPNMSDHIAWRAESATVSGSHHSKWVVDGMSRGVQTNDGDYSGTALDLRAVRLTVRPSTGEWQMSVPSKLQKPYSVNRVSISNMPGYSGSSTSTTDTQPCGTMFGTVSGRPGTTNGTFTLDQLLDGRPTRGFTKNHTVQFVPELDDVEVEVTIDGYAQWRPLGSISEARTPGNRVAARATLRPKRGTPQNLPAVTAFRFQLVETSREPGVAMNWPLDAKDEDYDLQLAAAAPFSGTTSTDGQTLEIEHTQKDLNGHPFALAQVESYDFGGRAMLRVVCRLADGREVVGKMRDGGKELDRVPLPKRPDTGWIAESWRRAHAVAQLPEADDDEVVVGQKHHGDGYTLYEEYRGFAVGGGHIEGDPKKKDFFVLNLIGADARPGIALFEQLSQLRVHARLRPSELAEEARLMNGNHRDAPHRVDQHGVWLKVFTRAALGDNGAATSMLKAGVTGRPGVVKGIGILARDNVDSVFNQPFNLPPQETVFTFDRAIAHELLHSVGVEHAGTGDYRQHLGYVSTSNPKNTRGRAYFGPRDDSPIDLLDEMGRDVAATYEDAYRALRQFIDATMRDRLVQEGRDWIARNGPGEEFRTSEQYADMMIERLVISTTLVLSGIVGVEHGEHSGDQDSVMRYYFAKFYEKHGVRTTQYLVTPGTERIGLTLCRSGRGTGINGPQQRPQSRYGDAKDVGYDCFAEITPNDAVPPGSSR